MKKLMLLTAIAVLAVSCRVEPLPSPENAIGFKTLNTRAFQEMDANNMESFAVFGEWVEGTNVLQTTNQFDFAYNKMVGRATNGGGTWSYEPVLYWPASGSINFYAYSPFASVNATNFLKTDAAPIIKYVNPDNAKTTAKKQEDLLVSAALGQNKTTATTGVQFHMYHALSQAKFVARNSLEDVYFEIVELRILNLDDTAKFNLATIALAGNADGYAQGRPLPTAWAETEDGKSTDIYTLQNGHTVVPYRPETNIYNQLGSTITIIPQMIDTVAKASFPNPGTNSIEKPDSAELALAAAKATGKQLVALKYRVFNAGNGSVQKADTWVFFNINLNNLLYNGSLLPAITENRFVMGARYTFVFDFNGSMADLIPIKFDVIGTNDWVNPNEIIILNDEENE